MIELKGIKKKFGELEVLKGIDLTIEKGEIVAIVGSSGAGKTTLLQILGTLDRPDSGDLFFVKTNLLTLKQQSLAKFRNQKIGFVFQFHQLLPEFTALENVLLPAMIGGTSRKKVEQKAIDLLRYLGVEDRQDHKPSQLSGGEQQRVAVARALINDPIVILADEPSGNLDSVTAKELHQLFFKLRDELNQTFIIVTHNQELASLADRTVVMKDGIISKD